MKPTILLADDDPAQLKLFNLYLTQAGFTVTTATNGKEALQKAHALPPTAIISDIHMPQLDGFELCLQIRKDTKLADTPVFLTSASLEETERSLAKKVGANGYFQRTADPDELLKALNEVLKSKSLSKNG